MTERRQNTEAHREYYQRYRDANRDRIAGHRKKHRDANRHRPEYKEAMRAAAAQWRQSNPERQAEVNSKQAAKRRGHVPLKFLPGETISGLIAQQKGLCPICDEPLSGRTHIDHCHKTGRARAVLHWNCNVGLGHLGESPETLERAAAYIRAHRARISGQS